MSKRKTFYVPAAIFSGGHSAYAVAIYSYLCFCADKNGVCFPGMETIAAQCGMARSTVKKALSELEQTGLIRSEATRQTLRSGKVRRGTNRYRINDTPVSDMQTKSPDGVYTPLLFVVGMPSRIRSRVVVSSPGGRLLVSACEKVLSKRLSTIA